MTKYIEGDINDVIITLDNNSIDLIYTDPPFSITNHYFWLKNNSTGFLSAKYQPLRSTEEIFIYYKKTGTYNPQMIGNKFYPKRNVKYGGQNAYWGKDGVNKKNEYKNEEGHYGNYPNNIISYPIRKDKTGITRTDEHIDYFIKTYSNENDTILDMTCHNNFVGDRCSKLKRNYIGVDLDIKLQ